jgi:cephalosporin-C deacetylase-like acetyl esterase
MNTRISIIAIVIMTLFMCSITGILFSAASDFPEETTPVALQTEYDTSFWNLTNATLLPLDVNNHTSVISTIMYQNASVDLNEWYFDFLSETFRGNDIRINSIIITRSNLTSSSPAILYLHGYHEQYADFMQMLREFAAAGYVAMGIDQPGSGNSSGFPALSPFTFLNVTSGPEDSSLFHSVWAAARSLTLLESLPQVRTDAMIVAGDSMGGLVTFIISGIDSRVDGSIPMISAGNFLNSLTSGSLLNSIVVPTYQVGSDELNNIIKWFDPIAYAKLLTKPVLMMFGTNDQFFPITSMMDTVEAITAELTLSIMPNWGHGILLEWEYDIIRWIDSHFREGVPLPKSSVSFRTGIGLEGSSIEVDIVTEHADKVFLCWRSSEPGAVWFFTELEAESGALFSIYTGTIVPLVIGKVLFFIITMQDDSTQISSRIYVGNAGSFFFPFLLVLSSFAIVSLLRFNIWYPRRIHLVREIPYVFGVLTLSAGFLQPFITIQGRTGLSVFGFIELYGESFLLGGWFLPAVLTGICFVIALSTFRHRFQFRTAVFVWLPVLFVVIILYIIFSGVFSFFGDILSIETGVGAVALIGAVPFMQILDRFVRAQVNRAQYPTA